MNADLERLITLQRLDLATSDARRRLSEEPERVTAFEIRLDTARQRVAAAREALAESQSARRTLEKDVAVHQGRLSKFRDQLMAVKTNQEYQAMQKEIAFAQSEVKTIEDKVLERMLEADDLVAAAKRAEADLVKEQRNVEADRRVLDGELAELKAALERLGTERSEIVGAVTPGVLAIFDLVAKRRNGVAVAEARDGICTICHVRLRPQVFNTVRRNDDIVQCDHCQRILFFSPTAAAPAADGVGRSAP
jgi:uncharacterized protein